MNFPAEPTGSLLLYDDERQWCECAVQIIHHITLYNKRLRLTTQTERAQLYARVGMVYPDSVNVIR